MKTLERIYKTIAIIFFVLYFEHCEVSRFISYHINIAYRFIT